MGGSAGGGAYFARIRGPQKGSTLRSCKGPAAHSGQASFFTPCWVQSWTMCEARQGRHVCCSAWSQAGRSSGLGNSEVEPVHGLLIPQARQVRVVGSLGVDRGCVTAGKTCGVWVLVGGSGLVVVALRRAAGLFLWRRGTRIGLFDTFVPLGSTTGQTGVEKMSPPASLAGLGAVALAAGSLLRFGAMLSDFVCFWPICCRCNNLLPLPSFK